MRQEEPALTYREFAPDAPFRPFIECFWIVVTGDVVKHLVVPDGCMDIIYSASGGLQAVGAMTGAREFLLARGERVVGVRFHPGGAGAFLPVPADRIRDEIIPLEEIWGRRARELSQRLADAKSGCEVWALAQALPTPGTEDSRIRPVIQAMMQSRGEINIDAAAGQCNLSLRQFRRKCLEDTGLSPKQLFRMLRFRNALTLLRGMPSRGAARVALEAGYYDQAHFIHEFRSLSGLTPAQFAGRQNVPFLQSSITPKA